MTIIDSTVEMQSIVFLMFVGTFGGAIRGNIQSCGIQKIIKNNPIVNQLMMLMLIYTFITKKDYAPKKQVTSLFGIYLLFTILNKNHIIGVFACTFLLLISFICKNMINYYNKQVITDKDNAKCIQRLKDIKKYCEILSLVCMLVGFLMYLQKQMREKGSNFNFIKFMFGSKKCSNL